MFISWKLRCITVDLKNIWEESLKKFKENLSSIVYDTWFSETELIDLNNNEAKIKVPTHVHKKYLKENYNDLICEVFNEIAGSNFNFNYYSSISRQRNKGFGKKNFRRF